VLLSSRIENLKLILTIVNLSISETSGQRKTSVNVKRDKCECVYARI